MEVKLSQIGEKFEDKESDEDLCKKLITRCSQRYFKLWHDHSSVDGHSYLLVLITPIYDPVFYLTPEEMEQKTGVYMDVQGIVEQPEVHIVGRSSSSTAEQMMFNECRQECLKEIGEAVHTSFGIAVNDTVRFFMAMAPLNSLKQGTSKEEPIAVLVVELKQQGSTILHTATIQRKEPTVNARSLSPVE